MTAEAHGLRARPLREGERRCLGLRTGLQAEGGFRGLEAKPARTVPPGLHRWDRLSLRRGDRVGHPSLGPRRCEAARTLAAKVPHSPTSLGVACTLTGEKTCNSLRFLLRNVKNCMFCSTCRVETGPIIVADRPSVVCQPLRHRTPAIWHRASPGLGAGAASGLIQAAKLAHRRVPRHDLAHLAAPGVVKMPVGGAQQVAAHDGERVGPAQARALAKQPHRRDQALASRRAVRDPSHRVLPVWISPVSKYSMPSCPLSAASSRPPWPRLPTSYTSLQPPYHPLTRTRRPPCRRLPVRTMWACCGSMH